MHEQFKKAGFDPQVRELSSFYDDYGLKEYPVDHDDDEEGDEDYDEDEESDEQAEEVKDQGQA